MADTPVVLVHGARQTGKSTLVKAHAESADKGHYLTLDDATMLAAATEDPAGFLSRYEGSVVLDEVQRVPGLFQSIKLAVDRDRQPGRYLLTGSADVLLLPNLSESLAGRMEILTLWPFSGSELAGHSWSLVDALFEERPLPSVSSPETRPAFLERVITGGFPEAVRRGSSRRRNAWFGSYVTTILQRDVRELSNIENLTILPRLLSMLAARAGSLINLAELSRALGLPHTTLTRYMTLLEATFLVRQLPPWSANLGKRLVKAPKMVLCDTGLMAYLLGIDSGDTVPEHLIGRLVENYAAMELTKHLGWSDTRATLYHFRESAGREVDILLENAAGQVVGIEVKASASVSKNDFRHLHFLRERLGGRFFRGVVFYAGSECVSFDEQLEAVPLGVLGGA